MHSRKLIAVIVGVLILIGLYFIALPQTQPSEKAGARVFDLEVKNRKLIMNPPIIKVVQGDQVTFRIKADERGEFHVHTYDVELDVEAGQIAIFRFNATLAGRYDLEWHLPKQAGQEKGEEIVVGTIEVSPKT